MLIWTGHGKFSACSKDRENGSKTRDVIYHFIGLVIDPGVFSSRIFASRSTMFVMYAARNRSPYDPAYRSRTQTGDRECRKRCCLYLSPEDVPVIEKPVSMRE